MPKRKDGFNEAPISFPAEELAEIRQRYNAEFSPGPYTKLETLEAWAGRTLRPHAEGRLYVFNKYVLGMGDMVPGLHGKTADWVQDMDPGREYELTPELRVHGGRRKLVMLPIGHLKTSTISHGLTLHAIVQPEGGLYFPEMPGQDIRILLHGETVDKAAENLSFIRQHLEFNRVLRWLWPACMWEKRKDAGLWTDSALTVRRSGRRILPEPTITSIGIGTALEQRHFDLIIIDDLATFEAAQSEVIMERARQRRKACRGRVNDPRRAIEIGVGTHWTPNDIYMDWRKDPSVEVCVRAAIENGEPIWPERWPLAELLAMQKEEGMGKLLFAANLMNNPLNSIFTALDWNEVRSFTFDELAGEISWEQTEVDIRLLERNSLSKIENANLYALYGRPLRGMTLDQLYEMERGGPEPESPDERHQRRLARLARRMDIEGEGTAQWMRLEWHRQRAVAQHEQSRHT